MRKPPHSVILLLASFACFSYGALAAKLKLWPAPVFAHAIEAYNAHQQQREEIEATMSLPQDVHLIKNVAAKARSVTIEPSKTRGGITLVSIGTDAAMLIDMSGKPLHTWYLPFSKIWEGKAPHVPNPNPDEMTRFITAQVYPNGDLLVIYHADNDTPYGYGMAKMDKDSNLLWSLPKNAHHSLYIAHDSSIYTLTHSFVGDVSGMPRYYKSPMLADAITILSEDGTEKDNIPIIEALLGTPYEQLLYAPLNDNDYKKHDYTHANAVMPLESAIAAKFPMFKPGQILVSLRNINAIAVIDPQTRKAVWAMRGIWKQQHEARFLPNGHIMLFDNLGYANGKSVRSRLLEIDPATGGIAWSFTGTQEQSFFSSFHGSQQVLPGGNLLTVETGEGNKLMEITPAKEVVWTYTVNPSNFRENPLNYAYRLPPGFLNADFCKEIGCDQKPAGKP